jgi:hypothetical protein
MPHTTPKVRSAVVEIHINLPILMEQFEPCAPAARPGYCLLNQFTNQVTFALTCDSVSVQPPDPPAEGGVELDFDVHIIHQADMSGHLPYPVVWSY